MLLTEHFSTDEFEHDGDLLPIETIHCLSVFCGQVLEPIRLHFAEPFFVTSGYRSAATNAAINGVPTSEHIYTSQQCAVDGFFPSFRKNMRPVFDWVRESDLPFHQVGLEHGKYGDIIHVSWSNKPVRTAFEGATFNASGYKSWPVGKGISA